MKKRKKSIKVAEKYTKFSTAEKRYRIAEKHARDSSACEGIIIEPAALKKAKEIIATRIKNKSV